MSTPFPAARSTSNEGPGSWREMAVARSLDPARARAENRVKRFLDAALELMNRNREFTVQEVVERSGQSLRSFYQYFTGKDELLLALFEESVRATAEQLEERIADESDPVERLRIFASTYYELCRPATKGQPAKKRTTPAMGQFAQQLLTSHPEEAAHAFQPLVALLQRLFDGAAEAGAIRRDLRHDRIAGVVLQAVMFNAFATTISGAHLDPDDDSSAEELWQLLLHGIGAG